MAPAASFAKTPSDCSSSSSKWWGCAEKKQMPPRNRSLLTSGSQRMERKPVHE